jgi:F-type H+-transporting ATPase subunit b
MSSDFGFNTDVLETNVLNLAVVVSVVVVVVGDALRRLLEQRRQTILSTLQEVEQKSKAAQRQLVEAQRSVETARIYAQEIRTRAVQDAEQESNKIRQQLKLELQRIRDRGDKAIQIEYQRTVDGITQQVTQGALFTAEKVLLSALSPNGESFLKQTELNETYMRDTFRQLKGWSSIARLSNTYSPQVDKV